MELLRIEFERIDKGDECILITSQTPCTP